MTVKATKAFHAWDTEQARSITFRPGDEVPAHIADTVGDHVVDRGDSSDGDTELKGAELDAAVKAANDDGADIKVSGTADEKRAALAAWDADED